MRGAHRPPLMGGGGVVAVGPSEGSTVECNMGDGVSMGVTADGVVTGADGCASVSARRTCAFDRGSSWQWHTRYRMPRLDPGRTIPFTSRERSVWLGSKGRNSRYPSSVWLFPLLTPQL